MNKGNNRTWGWILAIGGVIACWKPISSFFRVWRTWPRARSLFLTLRAVFRHMPSSQKLWLAAGIVLLIVGIVLIVGNRQATEYWQTRSRARIRGVTRKIEKISDPKELFTISSRAPLNEVRNAASERRNAVLREMVETGGDPAAIREAADIIIKTGMYDRKQTDLLAEIAKKYPDIIREYWPQLESWAHTDSKSHNDEKSGYHTDRTEYYDYFRYPDGRTVANKNGRKRHTDARGSYSDCHEDRHQDSTLHNDKVNADAIARFKPWKG